MANLDLLNTQTAQTQAPGRSCPLSYQYGPAVFAGPAQLHTNTVYAVGGLYGNLYALEAIEAMFNAEPGVAGQSKHLVFNGDFHWFDIQADLFAAVNARVTAHIALRGNVETEIAQAHGGADCGCAYPAEVDDGTVERSNAIITILRSVAQQDPARCARLAALPMYLTAQVGAARVGIMHGDAQSLAGWQFDAAVLDDPVALPALTRMFHFAKTAIFASSHTCASALRVFEGIGAVINNGAAGMSSVPGAPHGVVARIGTAPAPQGWPVLASAQVAGVFVQALAVQFDAAAWQTQFLKLWPPGSAAHTSYWQRIVHGPTLDTLHAPVDHHSCAE
jgi:hypothetical protein